MNIRSNLMHKQSLLRECLRDKRFADKQREYYNGKRMSVRTWFETWFQEDQYLYARKKQGRFHYQVHFDEFLLADKPVEERFWWRIYNNSYLWEERKERMESFRSEYMNHPTRPNHKYNLAIIDRIRRGNRFYGKFRRLNEHTKKINV